MKTKDLLFAVPVVAFTAAAGTLGTQLAYKDVAEDLAEIREAYFDKSYRYEEQQVSSKPWTMTDYEMNPLTRVESWGRGLD